MSVSEMVTHGTLAGYRHHQRLGERPCRECRKGRAQADAEREGREWQSVTGFEFKPQPWSIDALCAQSDPEVWFPDKGGSNRLAKQICKRCPVQEECLQYALATGQRYGVWGGTSEHERRRMSGESAA